MVNYFLIETGREWSGINENFIVGMSFMLDFETG